MNPPGFKYLPRFFFGCLLLLLAGFAGVAGAQQITPASGGGEISVDDLDGAFTTLTGPVITETSAGQLTLDGLIIFKLPAGFTWDVNTTPSVSINLAPGQNGQTQLQIAFESITTTEIRFRVTRASDSGGNRHGQATFSGFRVRPTQGVLPVGGNILNSGTTAPRGSNVSYGNLKAVHGAETQIRVQTSDTGNDLGNKQLKAGEPLAVWSNITDQFGNFIRNGASDSWELVDISGGIDQSDLNASGDMKSAGFMSEIPGSAVIKAEKSGLITQTSGLITVTPADPHALSIQTQPSDTTTAGVVFHQQPVIHVKDLYGNLVTSESDAVITASVASGSGELHGTVYALASGGIATFSSLSHRVANPITLKFSSPDLTTVISDTITVNPAAPHHLIFVQQPTNTSRNQLIDPPVTVRLRDQYDNHAFDDDVSITMSMISGGGTLNGTKVRPTDSQGVAVFDDLSINNNGTKKLGVSGTGLVSAESNTFTIVSPGALVRFRILGADSNEIGTQTAGESFDIRIEALDGNHQIVENFEDSVDISSTSSILSGGGTTPAFQQGVLASHAIRLGDSGGHSLHAVKTGDGIDGESNPFQVEPAGVDLSASTVFVEPAEIVADGQSEALITVWLRDEFGNQQISGGEPVSITAGSGLVSAITDHSDGTYTATLTSTTSAETDIAITAEVGGQPLASGPDSIDFIAGPLDQFLVEAQGGGEISEKAAGESFAIRITAHDAHNNTVTGFSDNVVVGSIGTLTQGEGPTAGFTGGILDAHNVTLTSAGEMNISVVNSGGAQTGQSNTFTVHPLDPDPATISITSAESIIQNEDGNSTVITVQLKDEFGNFIQSGGPAVSLSLQTDNPATENAALSSVQDHGDGTYTATLTATTTIEQVTISGTVSGVDIIDQTIVFITVFNTWTSGAGGPHNSNWNRGTNWTLGVPVSSQAIVIPENPTGASAFPVLDGGSSTVTSMIIQEGAFLTVTNGATLNITGNAQGEGTFVGHNSTVSIGGNLLVSVFNAGTSTVTLNGSNTQHVSSLMQTATLILENTSSAGVTTDSYFNADFSVVINDGRLTVQDGGWLDVFGDVSNITGPGELRAEVGSLIEVGGDVDNNHNDVKNGIVVFSGSSEQQINTMTQFGKLTIDNFQGVVFTDDITVDGLMTLVDNSATEITGDLTGNGTIEAGHGTVRLGGSFSLAGSDFSAAHVVMNGTAPQTLNNLQSLNDLTIDNSSGVTSNENLTIDGQLHLSEGNLIMASGTSLFADNQVIGDGYLTFKREISGSKGWRMLSSPISTDWSDFLDKTVTQGFAGSDIDSLQPNVLWYDETFAGQDNTDNQRWRAPSSAADSLPAGRGFFVYFFGDVSGDERYKLPLPLTLDASGLEYEFEDNEIDFALTYTAEADTGWNLVGNPFGAAIYWNHSAWSRSHMDQSMYVWDANANGGNGEYRVFNGITGSHSGRLPPFQAFWVKANSEEAAMKLNTAGKTTGGTFYKQQGDPEEESAPPLITLRLEKENLTGSTYFMFNDKARKGKDEYDAYRLRPLSDTYIKLYSRLANGSELVINNLPPRSFEPYEIPLGAGGYINGTPISGEVRLSWPQLVNIPENWVLTLIDNETGDEINLAEQEDYLFEMKSDDCSRRHVKSLDSRPDPIALSVSGNSGTRFTFRIVPDEPDAKDIPQDFSMGQNYPNPFNPLTTIRFALPEETHVDLVVYDILGRRVATLLSETREPGFHEVKWNAVRFASGVYIYRIQAGRFIKTKKMTVIR